MVRFLNFGRIKKLFIQQANRRSAMRGTIGSFNRWCRSQRLTKDGKVTRACIKKGLRSKNTTIVRRANFARNIGGYVGAKHRRSRFGKRKAKLPFNQKGQNPVYARTRFYKKYSKAGGRKSPGESAKAYRPGTVRTGLDGNKWKIQLASNGVPRWVKMNSFGKRKKTTLKNKRTSRFGNEMIFDENFDYDSYLNLDKNLDYTEKVLEKLPETPGVIKAETIIQKIKKKMKKIFTRENMIKTGRDTVAILKWTADLFITVNNVKQGYTNLHESSSVFRGVTKPLTKVLDKLSDSKEDFKQIEKKELLANGWVETLIDDGSEDGIEVLTKGNKKMIWRKTLGKYVLYEQGTNDYSSPYSGFSRNYTNYGAFSTGFQVGRRPVRINRK